jgi:hypothetical protein
MAFTYEYIRDYINSKETGNGCRILISEEDFTSEKIRQNKSNTNVKFQIQCGCKNNNIFTTSFDKFKSRDKKQCNDCGKLITKNKRLLPYQYIKNFIDVDSESGCKLLSIEYDGIFDKLDVQCKCGNTFEVSFDAFKYSNVRRCNECYIRSLNIEQALPYEEVKKFIEVDSNSRCKLMSDKYVNAHENLLLKCYCGNDFEVNFNKFKSSNQRQCQECGNKNIGDKLRKPYEEVKYLIEVESNSGCKLRSKTYTDAKSNLNIECKCGNGFITTYDSFSNGKRQCNECAIKLISEKLKTPYYDIKKILEGENSNGCKLLTSDIDYVNTNGNILMECACGNEFITTYNNFIYGNKRQCDECSKIKKKLYCIEKYGFEHPMQNKEIYAKVIATLNKNGTTPCSSQQRYVHRIVGGELNYPYYNASLDIAFPEEMIYCECDFGGHWLSIKLGGLTQDEFDKKQRNRWYSLYRSGWREIRIISTHDLIPSDTKLLEILAYARTYLNQNHHYIKFDIDNSKIINSQGELPYGFGELRKIKPTDIQEQEAI